VRLAIKTSRVESGRLFTRTARHAASDPVGRTDEGPIGRHVTELIGMPQAFRSLMVSTDVHLLQIGLLQMGSEFRNIRVVVNPSESPELVERCNPQQGSVDWLEYRHSAFFAASS
jgi:hypothetical protein